MAFTRFILTSCMPESESTAILGPRASIRVESGAAAFLARDRPVWGEGPGPREDPREGWG